MTSSDEAAPAVAAPPPEVQHPALAAPFASLPDVAHLMRDPSVAAAALLYGRIPPMFFSQLDAVRQRYLEPHKPELAAASDEPMKKLHCQFADCQFKSSAHFHCPYSECKAFNFRYFSPVSNLSVY